VLPGTMGCLQATEVLKILLGKTDGLLVGRVLVFDAMAMKFTEVGLPKSDGRVKITELIDYHGFCAGPKATTPSIPPQAEQQKIGSGRTMDEAEISVTAASTECAFHNIDPRSALDKLQNGWSPWVLDVRLPSENEITALPFVDANVVHRSVLPKHIPRHGDVLVICKSGGRSKKAIDRLVEYGVDPDRLYNLDGGMMKWQKDVDPSMPRY